MSAGKWLKGQSGNPLGRPKGATTLDGVRAFRKYEADIFTAYKSLLTDPDGKVRAKGVELGLAYLFGKPSESLPQPPASGQLLTWTPDQLEAAEAQLEAPGAEQAGTADPAAIPADAGDRDAPP